MLKLQIIRPGEPETKRWTADMLKPGQVATVTGTRDGADQAIIGSVIRRLDSGLCVVLNHESRTGFSEMRRYEITPPEPVGTRIVMTVEV